MKMMVKTKTAEFSRRHFLRTSASAASLAALTAGLQTKLYATGGEEMKVGLIGCGGRGAGAVVSALTVNPNEIGRAHV